MSTIANHYPGLHTGFMNNLQRFGQLVRDTRTARGMLLVDLGNAIGRSINYMSRLERGTASNPPEPADFIALSKVLGLSRLRMLRALGYLEDADLDTANGPAYQIQPDDPLVPIIDQLRGVPDTDLATIRQLIDVVLTAYTRKAMTGRHFAEGNTETTIDRLG